ncbi:type II secretion system minor pseudopilin GspI [Escherichia coli]|nr:type II secretion system minor pseudopilin GspI [Escherichia coli]
MKAQKGMTLLEVMVALIVFALAGIALMQTVAQQVGGIGRMEEKVLASWLADNQMVQLHLEKIRPEKSWNEKAINFAGIEWHMRWRSPDSKISELCALDVEVRRSKEDESAVFSLHNYMVCE